MTAIGQYEITVDDSADPPFAHFHEQVGSPRYEVVGWKDDLIAVKVPGRHYHGGQGQPQNYSPAQWKVYRVVKEHGDGRLIVEEVLSWLWRS